MTASADDIRQRMQQVRCELGDGMDDIVESTREMTDWRSYVEHYPWLCAGAAAALGYLVVPKRVELLSPNADTLLELAKRNKLVVNTNPQAQAKSGLTGTLLTFLANAAVRSAIAFAGQKLGKEGGSQAPAATADETAAPLTTHEG